LSSVRSTAVPSAAGHLDDGQMTSLQLKCYVKKIELKVGSRLEILAQKLRLFRYETMRNMKRNFSCNLPDFQGRCTYFDAMQAGGLSPDTWVPR